MELQLSTSEMEVLRNLQRNLAGSSDYARVTCILMLGMGNTPSFVASCLGIDASTVYRYRSAYLHGGTDKLLENRYKGYWGLLDSRNCWKTVTRVIGVFLTAASCPLCARNCVNTFIRTPRAWQSG